MQLEVHCWFDNDTHTDTFQLQFQHTHFNYSFNIHISGTVSTHTFQLQCLNISKIHYKSKKQPGAYKNRYDVKFVKQDTAPAAIFRIPEWNPPVNKNWEKGQDCRITFYLRSATHLPDVDKYSEVDPYVKIMFGAAVTNEADADYSFESRGEKVHNFFLL